jgi:hypothetical protein
MFIVVSGVASGLGVLIGAESKYATSASLAWCFYGGGMIMLLLAIPREEPRQHDQERALFGLRETAATALSLALGALLIAAGVVIQIR